MVFRFVHTADLHLDSPLCTLALTDPDLGAAIAGATRRAFSRIVDACLDERVDALIIAGDLYDREIRSMATPLFLGREFRRLADAAIRVFVARGNHDAEAVVTRHLSLPDNVHVFSTRGDKVVLDAFGVAIHGVGFPKGQVAESLLPKFGPPLEGLANIGVLHTSLAGAEGHDVYAPCSLAELLVHGFEYWALGHVHRRRVHSMRPAVVMPGMPQGRDVGEAGPKSATLATLGDDRSVALAEIPTAIAEFARLSIDISPAGAWRDLAPHIEAALGAARAASRADMLVARLDFIGLTPLAYGLRRDRDRLAAEARQAAEIVGGVLVEKVDLSVGTIGTKSVDAGPFAELATTLVGEPPAHVLAQARETFDELVAGLPVELRERFGADEAASEAVLRRLMTDGAADILARLASSEEA